MSASSRSPRSWREGDPILFREVYRGRLWTARPATVSAVRDDLIALYLAPGTIFKVPAETTHENVLERLHQGWQLRDHVWRLGRTLHLLRPGVAHAIHLWWLPPDWRFGGWYINLQEPIRPTPLGFDSMDHVLDVVIDPDLSWRWKDEEELATAADLGLLTSEQARDIRPRVSASSASSRRDSRPSATAGIVGNRTRPGPSPRCRRAGTSSAASAATGREAIMPDYPKLVRDRIPELILATAVSHGHVAYRMSSRPPWRASWSRKPRSSSPRRRRKNWPTCWRSSTYWQRGRCQP